MEETMFLFINQYVSIAHKSLSNTITDLGIEPMTFLRLGEQAMPYYLLESYRRQNVPPTQPSPVDGIKSSHWTVCWCVCVCVHSTRFC